VCAAVRAGDAEVWSVAVSLVLAQLWAQCEGLATQPTHVVLDAGVGAPVTLQREVLGKAASTRVALVRLGVLLGVDRVQTLMQGMKFLLMFDTWR